MPEGPEVWILSKAINSYYGFERTESYGKHLFIFNDDFKSGGQNWSFGLTGKVQIKDNNELIKISNGWINGDELVFNDYNNEKQKLGINWLTSSKEELHKLVDSWIKSKKKLAALILDQTKISGIGVAWGSEILFKANLRPDMRTCDQVLNKLADTMYDVGMIVKQKYTEELEEWDTKSFINEWFENLYEIRDMNIYKKGSKLTVLGRSWWL